MQLQHRTEGTIAEGLKKVKASLFQDEEGWMHSRGVHALWHSPSAADTTRLLNMVEDRKTSPEDAEEAIAARAIMRTELIDRLLGDVAAAARLYRERLVTVLSSTRAHLIEIAFVLPDAIDAQLAEEGAEFETWVVAFEAKQQEPIAALHLAERKRQPIVLHKLKLLAFKLNADAFRLAIGNGFVVVFHVYLHCDS